MCVLHYLLLSVFSIRLHEKELGSFSSFSVLFSNLWCVMTGRQFDIITL